MRFLSGTALLFALVSFVAADASDAKEARQRWLRGNYAEARELYEALAKDPKTQVSGVIGVSLTWQSEGEYDKALAVIAAALPKHPQDAALLARHAELLYLRGQWQEAEAAASKAIEQQKDNFLARWVRAQLYRDRGEQKQADLECRWFVRTYSQLSNADMDLKDPDALLLVGLAGAENARWHNLSDQFRVILNDVYGDALKNDKAYWPAEYHAGLLLLEKYNRPEANQAFDKALKINPNAAEPLVGKALIALSKFEIRDAENLAERALKINPNLPEALHLRADLHLATGNLSGALKELATARKVNPRDERTLGRLAACLLLQKKQAEFDALAKEVAQHNTAPGTFYHELAERLEERKHFDAAEGYFKKSIELRPLVPFPRNSLGLLMMRLGREKEARTQLTKAFEADPFNVQVSNTLKVLRHLDKYETLKTAHFELRFDAKTDRALAHYMADQLEVMHAELAKKFAYQPPGLILVEVFNTHEMFSGRVVALPDLHTIGACTGRMFAMVSPNGKGIGKPFNWARVLRHELVHIFNLEQTHFQCPHWLTEGLAVQNEQFPRPQSWNQILLEKVPAGDLLTLDTINLGFIRPRSPVEWHQAYCQSHLYVQHLEARYGPDSIGRLLHAFADGLAVGDAIQKVCKVDQATFEKGYLAHLQDVVKTMRGKPVEKALTFTQLQEAQEKDPENVDLSARLAEQFVERRRNTEARKLVEGILAKQQAHPLASCVKARLLLAAGDEEGARKVLEAALDEKAPDAKVALALGKVYFEARELEKAAATFELGRKAQPYDSRWLVELAKVYAQTNDRPKQLAVMKDLVLADADDFDIRKRLARLLLEAEQFAEAEKYGRQALEINIKDTDVQGIVEKALHGQNKAAEAARLRKLLES